MVTPQLLAGLRSAKTDDVIAAARAIQELGESGASAAPELMKCLAHRLPAVRIAARAALSKLGPEAWALLARGLPDSDCAVALKEALPGSLDAVNRALLGPQVGERRGASWILSSVPEAAAASTSPLARALVDDDEEVRSNALKAVEKLDKAAQRSVFAAVPDAARLSPVAADLERSIDPEVEASRQRYAAARTAAEDAAKSGDLEALKRALSQGVDLGPGVGSLLECARPSPEVYELLMSLKPGRAELTIVLDRAISDDRVGLARAVLQAGADTRALRTGLPPLHRAKSLAMGKALIEAGADPSQPDDQGRSAYAHRCLLLQQAVKLDLLLGDEAQLVTLYASPGAETGEALLARLQGAKSRALEEALAKARSGRTAPQPPSLAQHHGYAVLRGKSDLELYRVEEAAARLLDPVKLWLTELPDLSEHEGATLVVAKRSDLQAGFIVPAEVIERLADAKVTLVIWLSLMSSADPLAIGAVPLGGRRITGTAKIAFRALWGETEEGEDTEVRRIRRFRHQGARGRAHRTGRLQPHLVGVDGRRRLRVHRGDASARGCARAPQGQPRGRPERLTRQESLGAPRRAPSEVTAPRCRHRKPVV